MPLWLTAYRILTGISAMRCISLHRDTAVVCSAACPLTGAPFATFSLVHCTLQ